MINFNCNLKANDSITCQKKIDEIGKAFQAASKILKANETQFNEVNVFAMDYNNPVTLDGNIFGDITFKIFMGDNIGRFGTDVFNRTANKMSLFYCVTCALENQPPQYDLPKMLNQMTELDTLSIGLNITELRTDFINHPSKIKSVYLHPAPIFSIKSNALLNLNQLESITISDTQIKRIEKDAFKFNNRNDKMLRIWIENCLITGDTFETGVFSPGKSQFMIELSNISISYLNEGAFKPILDANEYSFVHFQQMPPEFSSNIDCDDCKNYWLIKQKRDKQILNALCKTNAKKKLFDKEIQDKLTQKCK